MITIDFPISFLAGVGFAFATKSAVSIPGGPSTAVPRERCILSPGLFYQAFFLTPVIVYFMTRYADWEWHYLFDARKFFLIEASATSSILFCITIALTVLFHQMGFAMTRRLLLGHQCRQAKVLAIAAILVTVGIPLFFLHQATHVGLYADYLSGRTPAAWNDTEYLLTLVVSGLIVIPPYSLALRRLRQ